MTVTILFHMLVASTVARSVGKRMLIIFVVYATTRHDTSHELLRA
jgi:hypothetical protein